MTSGTVDKILQDLPKVVLYKGDHVFGPKTTMGRLVRVESGFLQQKILGINGQSTAIQFLRPGEYAGLLYHHSEETSELVTEVASEEATIRKIQEPQLTAFKRQEPEWYFQRQIELHTRMLLLWNLFQIKVEHDLHTLLICQLCKLCLRFGQETDEGVSLEVNNLRYKDIANMTGCRLATISRRMSKLKEEDLFAHKEGDFLFPNTSDLRDKSERNCEDCSILNLLD